MGMNLNHAKAESAGVRKSHGMSRRMGLKRNRPLPRERLLLREFGVHFIAQRCQFLVDVRAAARQNAIESFGGYLADGRPVWHARDVTAGLALKLLDEIPAFFTAHLADAPRPVHWQDTRPR